MADTQTSNEVSVIDTLNNIVEDTNAALVQSSNVERQVVANLGVIEGIQGEIAGLQEIQAKDKALIAATEQAAALRAQQYTLKAANAAGIDPSKASDFMLERIGKFTEAVKLTEEKTAELRRKDDSSILDDPVQWISDLFTIPQTRKELQRAAQDTQMYSAQITTANNLVSQAASTANTIKESITAVSAEAATRNAANEAMQAAARSRIDAIKYNSMGMEAAMNATKERLNILYNKNSAEQAEQSQRMVFDRWEAEKENRNWERERKAAETKAKEENKSVDDYQVETINIGRAAMGLEPLTGTALLSAKKLMGAGGSKDLLIYYDIGERSRAAGVPVIGSSPAESVNNIKNSPFQPAPGRERAIELLRQADAAAAQDVMNPGGKDEKLRAAFINKFVLQETARLFANPGSDPTNPFNVGDLKSYLQLSTVASTAIAQKVLKDAAAAGVSLDDPKKVVGLGLAAVRSGKITSQEFQDLATIYQQANLVNQQANHFVGLGIQIPHAGRKYFAKLSNFGEPVDLASPTELGRYLMKQRAEEITPKSFVNKGFNTPYRPLGSRVFPTAADLEGR